MNIKVKTISFLKPNPKPCVRRPCIWWGFLPSLTRTNMIWVDTRPKLDESPTNNKAQSYMVTSLIPPGSVAKSLNLGYQLPLCLKPTHYVLCGPTSLALWIEWLEPSPVAPSQIDRVEPVTYPIWRWCFLSQRLRVMWALVLWHYERTLYSRRPPLKGTGVLIYLEVVETGMR